MKRRLILKFIYSTILLSLISCSGYQFKSPSRPSILADINSVAIPMFINHSVFPNIAGPFTKEISLLFAKYPGLRVYPGESPKAAAILLGIISSAKRKSEAFTPQGSNRKTIGRREIFNIPGSTKYVIGLRLILIRRPTPELLKIAKSELGPILANQRNIVINTSFELTSGFSRISNTGKNGDINFTQSKANFHKSVEEIAKVAAIRLQQEVLDAF